MNWNEQIFRYCERGQDPDFWAEPFNAASNLAFLLVAALSWRRYAGSSASPTSDGCGASTGPTHSTTVLLIALVATIGVGSFLFHTFATRWSRTADVAPIGLFMAVYLVVALRSFLGFGAGVTAMALTSFVGVSALAATMACPSSLRSITDVAREPCLKGTVGYVPALAALLLVGLLLRRRPEIARRLLVAAGLFSAAMLLRWLDRDLCPVTRLFGQSRGTHALWHLLVAACVYQLMAVVIDHRRCDRRQPLRVRQP